MHTLFPARRRRHHTAAAAAALYPYHGCRRAHRQGHTLESQHPPIVIYAGRNLRRGTTISRPNCRPTGRRSYCLENTRVLFYPTSPPPCVGCSRHARPRERGGTALHALLPAGRHHHHTAAATASRTRTIAPAPALLRLGYRRLPIRCCRTAIPMPPPLYPPLGHAPKLLICGVAVVDPIPVLVPGHLFPKQG